MIDQDDYISTSCNVTFSPDESEKSVKVPIINDLSREHSEIFYSYLTFSHQSEFLPRSAGAITEISYNDCKINIWCRGSMGLHARSIMITVEPLKYTYTTGFVLCSEMSLAQGLVTDHAPHLTMANCESWSR